MEWRLQWMTGGRGKGCTDQRGSVSLQYRKTQTGRWLGQRPSDTGFVALHDNFLWNVWTFIKNAGDDPTIVMPKLFPTMQKAVGDFIQEMAVEALEKVAGVR